MRSAECRRPRRRAVWALLWLLTPDRVSIPPWFNTRYTPDKRRGTSECFTPTVMRPHSPSGCQCPLEPMTSS
jgi:hypothetical protein